MRCPHPCHPAVIHSLTHGRNGIDIIAQKQIGSTVRTMVVEVKVNGSKMSELQRLGATGYVQNVLGRLGKYNLSPSAMSAKFLLQKTINNSPTNSIPGLVMQFDWRPGKVFETIRRWTDKVRI